MHTKWTNSEKLKLLLLHKDGVDWASSAEKMNEEYRERPKNFFNEKNCKAEFDRICNEACPKQISADEPTQSFKKSTVIDAWIVHLKEHVKLDADKMVEMGLVEVRKQAELIKKIMNREQRPSGQEMLAMLAKVREENEKSNRDPSQKERVESVFRTRVKQMFEEQKQRESDGNTEVAMPHGSLSISPTKPSNVALQQAFRSPSPIKSPITSPIRPLAEAIEEADAEMVETVEDPKMEEESPVASPVSKISSSNEKRDKEKSSTVSPRTAADRAIGDGGLEEEMEEEEEEEEDEIVKEEEMEVEEEEEEETKEEEEKPVPTRKSTRVSTTSVDTTPVRSGKEKRKKDPSPQSSESTTSKKEEDKKEKEEAKEEEGRVRRSSMRGRPPATPATAASPSTPSTPSTPALPTAAEVVGSKAATEEKEEGAKTRRSSRMEKVEDKSEDKKEVKAKKEEKKKEGKKEEKKEDEKEEKEGDEGTPKRVTRRSAVEKEEEKTEEKESKESKEEVTFVAPSVTPRTRNHNKGSEHAEEKEKEKSEEPLKTRSGSRHSLSGKSGSESKDSPVPSEKKTKKGEKREEESDEKETRGRKEISVALSETSLVGLGGRKEAEILTEVSIRHPIAPSLPISPSKTRRGTERESPSTPVARKSSRVSSSTPVKAVMVSVEVQTDKLEMKHDDEVFVSYDSNEHYFNPVCDVERGRGRPKKEIKTETEEEKPVSRRTRGGEVSEDEGGSRSGSVCQSEKGTPSRRKESKRDMMTLHLDVDDDTGRYWLVNGAAHAESLHESPGPSTAKKSRASMAEISGRRSVVNMDPMRQALFKACRDMELHRHSSVFKANVAQKDAPDYYDCVHQPVCLSKLKNDVIEGRITDSVSLMRQFAIMFMNGAMYNSTAHDYWMYAVEMFRESYKPIRDILPAELAMAEEDEIPKHTRARRNNEPAFAKDAVLTDRDRSMTLDRFFKCESVDGDEVATSADVDRSLYTRNKVDSTRKRKL